MSNVVQIESPDHGAEQLTDAKAEKIIAMIAEKDLEVDALTSQMATIDSEVAELTQPEREQIQALNAQIVTLQAQAKAKAQAKENEKAVLVSKRAAILTATRPDRQRVSAYAAKRMQEITNKFSRILPSKANSLIAKPASQSSGKRHGKGCQDGTLRSKGGVCQLCQSEGKW